MVKKALAAILRLFILVQIGFILSIGVNIGYRYLLGEEGKLFKQINPAFENDVALFVAISVSKQEDAAKREEMITKYKTLTLGLYKNEKDPNDTTIAWCNHLTNEIGVNVDSFVNLTPQQQQVSIFHELGHCLMDKRHTDYSSDWWENFLIFFRIIPKKGYYEDKCPKSLMHPYLTSDYCLDTHAEEYLDDLFTW